MSNANPQQALKESRATETAIILWLTQRASTALPCRQPNVGNLSSKAKEDNRKYKLTRADSNTVFYATWTCIIPGLAEGLRPKA